MRPATPTAPSPLRRRAAPTIAATVVLVAVALGALALAADPAAAASAGRINALLNATSRFDRLIASPTPAERQFVASRYHRVRGYSSYFDQALGWTPPSRFYKDLYALYRGQAEGLIDQHPDWVLRDADGNRLYIPFGCGGGSCPQYAADVGNPGWRAHWIAKAREVLSRGYAGIFIDDANLTMWVGDGSGNRVAPIDPRTGGPMTTASWRRYVAEFLEQIRAAFPGAEIVHNAGQWWLPRSDPYVQRQVAAADAVEIERGFNDGGLTGGTGKFAYRTLLDHIDWLHGRGADVVIEPYNLNATSREFEIASYLLISTGRDALVPQSFEGAPGDWWPGWEIDLGSPDGPRYEWNGLQRRDFCGGTVLTNEPGAPSRSASLPPGPRWTRIGGEEVTAVTLGARRGAVLLRDDGDRGDCVSGDVGGDHSRGGGGAPCACGGGDATGDGATGGGDGAAGGRDRGGCRQRIELRKVRRGAHRTRAVTLRGCAAGADRVWIRVRTRRGWRTKRPARVATASGWRRGRARSVSPSRSGRFRVRVRVGRPGVRRFRANARSMNRSPVVRVRVRPRG